MSLDDFRRLIDATNGRGVAVEVDDATGQWPLTVTTMGLTSAASVPLTEDEGRRLFDALAEALALVATRSGAAAAAGRDTPTRPQD